MKNQDSSFYQKNIIYGHNLNSNIKIEIQSGSDIGKIFKCKTVFLSQVLSPKKDQNKKKSTQDIVYDKDSSQSGSMLAEQTPRADGAPKPSHVDDWWKK